MTHPIVLEALADAHRSDLVRAANRNHGVVAPRAARRRRIRLATWLKAQLHRPSRPAPAAGVANVPRCEPVTR
jgi:hypothetical protein